MLVQWTCHAVGNFFLGENMMVFNNLKGKPVKTTLYSLFNFPSIFIEARHLPAGFFLGRNSFRGTKK